MKILRFFFNIMMDIITLREHELLGKEDTQLS